MSSFKDLKKTGCRGAIPVVAAGFCELPDLQLFREVENLLEQLVRSKFLSGSGFQIHIHFHSLSEFNCLFSLEGKDALKK